MEKWTLWWKLWILNGWPIFVNLFSTSFIGIDDDDDWEENDKSHGGDGNQNDNDNDRIYNDNAYDRNHNDIGNDNQADDIAADYCDSDCHFLDCPSHWWWSSLDYISWLYFWLMMIIKIDDRLITFLEHPSGWWWFLLIISWLHCSLRMKNYGMMVLFHIICSGWREI